MSWTERTLERQALREKAVDPGIAPPDAPWPPTPSTPAEGDQCSECPYSLTVHAYAGEWLGCPADEHEAIARWGAR